MAIMRLQYVHEPADAVHNATGNAWGNGINNNEGICQTPNLNAKSSSAPVAQHPDPIDFFKQFVRPDGYPEQEATKVKSQPWRAVWQGPEVSKDGKLLIACPKGCDWGSGSGLGGY